MQEENKQYEYEQSNYSDEIQQNNQKLLESVEKYDYKKKIKGRIKNNLSKKAQFQSSYIQKYENAYENLGTGEDILYFSANNNFTQLCPEEKFDKTSENCLLCDKVIGTLFGSKRLNCYFCGGAVCKDCSKRKRPNPQDLQEFFRICDQCHFDYIFLQIQNKFLNKKQFRDEKLQQNENKYEIAKRDFLKLKIIYKQNENRLEQHQEQFKDNLEDLNLQIQNLEIQIKSIESNNELLNIQQRKINKKIEQIKDKLALNKQEQDDLIQQEQQLDLQISQQQSQTQKLDQQYLKMDQRISHRNHTFDNKSNQKQLNISNDKGSGSKYNNSGNKNGNSNTYQTYDNNNNISSVTNTLSNITQSGIQSYCDIGEQNQKKQGKLGESLHQQIQEKQKRQKQKNLKQQKREQGKSTNCFGICN